MSTDGKWGDLGPRVISGLLLAGLGFALLYIGGLPMMAGMTVLGGLGIWELHRMLKGETVTQESSGMSKMTVREQHFALHYHQTNLWGLMSASISKWSFL